MLGVAGDVARRALDLCLLFPLLEYPFLFWDESEDTSDGASDNVSSISVVPFPFSALTYASSVSSPEESMICKRLLMFFLSSSEVSDSLQEDPTPSENPVLIVMLMVHVN
jgi:hypothetical protein